MKPDDLNRILSSLSAGDVREFNLRTGSYDLSLRRGPAGGFPMPMGVPQAPQAFAPAPAPLSAPAPGPAAAPAQSGEAQAAAPAPEAAAEAPTPPAEVRIPAPIVGRFYPAADPEARSLVRVGDTVSVGQVVCIIEALNLKNEILSEVAGTVRQICAASGDPVEYGQTLFVLG